MKNELPFPRPTKPVAIPKRRAMSTYGAPATPSGYGQAPVASPRAVAFAYPDLEPGGDQRQTLKLTHGTWTLYCSILDHRSLGMRATLTVNWSASG